MARTTCGVRALTREAERLGVSLLLVPAGREPEGAMEDGADWLAVADGGTAEVVPLTLAGELALSLMAAEAA